MASLSTNTRSVQIVSGSSSTTFDGTSTFTLSLPTSGYRSGMDEVALKSLTVYYSWANISVAKGNNTFSYQWNGTAFTVVMADGIWSFSDLNTYLQQVMVLNGHYLLDNYGNKQYYISITVNAVLYCLNLVILPIPASLPAGWSNPAAVTLSGLTPQLVIPQSFSFFTGFPAATYPAVAQSLVYQVNSGIPQVSTVTSLNLLCNLVDNSGFAISPQILTSFVIPTGQQPGSLVSVQPNNLEWNPIPASATFTTITVQLVDQLRNPIIIRDPSGFVAILFLRQRLRQR